MAKPSVLLLTLEYPRWADAGKYAYESNFGLEEGFAANGIACTTVPLMFCREGSPWLNWFNSVRRQLEGRRFDQVWFDVVHTHYPAGFLELIQGLAPVRVGFFGESSEFHPLELVNNAAGTLSRRENLARTLPVATHLIAVDEADVARFNAEGKTPAYWWGAGSIPERFITTHPVAPMGGRGVFHGTLYGNRKEWFARPELQGLLAQGTTMESDSPWPAEYDELNESVAGALAGGAILEEPMFSRFIGAIRQTRQACYPLWMQSLRQGCAVVNLPQFAQAYASRVTQGLAAGVPVVTWEIPNRPRTRDLFEPGREILLYSADQPAQLAEHIRRLQRDPGFARQLAENGLRRLSERNTTEKFIAHFMRWLETGEDGWKSTVRAAQPLAKPQSKAEASAHPLFEEIFAKAGGQSGQPIRLHLGCGEQRFDGYVNIDYPPAEHNVMNVKADVFTNVITMELPAGTIDEIRLHHVFEHFNRVTALAMLIKWQRWLKPGGILRIETPDLAGCARTLLANTSLRVKMGIVRHLAGDQAASWAYHLEHWFPERYVHTLRKLGFDQVQTKTSTWATEPFLSNVEALAVKTVTLPEEQLLALADELLRESMVADCEQPTWEMWRQQLRDCLRGTAQAAPINIPATAPVSTTVTEVIATAKSTPRNHRDLYLGLKFYGHDAAVFSVFPEEQDIFAIAEERLTRFKHDDLFPLDAIRRMLAYKGIDATRVENLHVGGAFRCQKDEKLPARAYDRTVALRRFLKAPYTKEFAQASREFFALPDGEQIRRLQTDADGREFLNLANDPTPPQTLDEQFRLALGEIFPNAKLQLNYHDHEYCHAVSAYYSSGFDRALVVAFDGWGDDNIFSRVYLAENGQLTEVSACRSATRELRVAPGLVHETSIGGIYSWFTRFLGFTPDADEGKVEALAAFGKWANAIYHDLMSLVAISPEGGIEINHAKATQLLSEERLRSLLAASSKEDFSAAVQKFTEEIVLAYLRPLVEKTGARKICLSGGVTANVILNLRIFQELAEEVFIIPAMADDGSAQGAAILELLGQGFNPADLKWLGTKQMPYWGSSYSPAEVRQRINRFNEQQGNCLAIQDDSAAWPETAAEAICRGETGAIFHGRMEWGPRALGNRSIIADARNPKMRDILNRDIKNRPSFQPFCPSMLAEERERLFERSYQNRHMTIAFEMKREFWEALPGAIHIDGTARVQFVEPADNPNYHRLLARVKEITGFGVILNTSFNKHGRTIVESPEDALRDFLDSKLDFVVIEGHVVRKAKRTAGKPRAKTTGIVFSKDRALQLDATLGSFALHCQDAQEVALTVLYTATSTDHEQAYEQLRPAYPGVNFVRENNFKNDLLALTQNADNVLFLVDDSLFIRDFSLREAIQHLEADPTALGFSLRLGQNTTYCYPLAQAQRLPEFSTRRSALAFHWPTAEHDFGYPLEVSSSLYRVADLAPLLAELDYRNPNTLEAVLAANTPRFTAKLPRLLCFAQSVAFCAPVNVVQSTYQNRCGTRPECSAATLAREFLQGARVDLSAFNGFVPTGCHQEVELKLTRGTPRPAPAVSVVIPCYNQAGYLAEAVTSVIDQTFADWEIVIVNDGSQDNTSVVARELIAAHATRRIRLLEKTNGGLSDARNTGVRSATGRFILPLDADDLLHPDFLAKTAACLEQQPATAIVYTDVEQFGVRNELWHTQSGDPRQVLTNTRHAYCALYRREVWEKVGGYNRNMVWGYEDWDFWVGCFKHGFQEARIAEPLMRYRTKAESMVTRALQHDAELRAQIIKNHPALYDAASNAWAEKTLREAKQTTQTGADDPVEGLLQSAGALFQTGDLRGVQMILERAATLAPENGEIAESLGTVAFQAGDMGLAFTHLGRAVALRPDNVETLVKLAMAAAQAGEIETFESSLARALELAPEHPSALRLLGGLNLQIQHWADAATTYYRLLRQNPADVDATLALGRCFYELKDLEAARDSFEQVLALDPANEIARDNLMVIQKKLPQPSGQGMPAPRTWPTPQAPASLDSILAAADQEFAAGNLTGARDQLRQAILLAPDNPQVIETLGSILFQLGDFGAAQVEFTLLADLSPDQARPLVKLALSQLRLGRIEEFEGTLGRALELEPENPDALRLLADLNRDHRSFAEAARLYLKLLGPNPQHVETLFSLAFCFFQSGELDAAQASYERILELEPANTVAQENHAVVVAKLTGTNHLTATALVTAVNEPATEETRPAANTTPRISVILPTYNRPAILARCLEGFAQQTLAREQFEIVVVDDGSEPPVAEVVATFTDRLRITCHFQTNAGLAAARNQAIALARAPWLALHDDDDVPAPDYLARCIAFHEAHPGEADILLARLIPHPDLEVAPLLEWVFDAANGVIGFPAPGTVHNFSKFYGGTSSCKRSLFTRAQYDPEYRFGFEDMELALRLDQTIKLQVHYHPEVFSELVRTVEFSGLFRRMYREGRSLRRCFEKHGQPALALMPEGIDRSIETLARIEPHMPGLFKLLEKLGTKGNPEITLALDGQVLRGPSALKAVYSLLSRFSRAKGWTDFGRLVTEAEGLRQINVCLAGKRPTNWGIQGMGDPASTPAETGVAPASAHKRALVYFHSNPFPARSGAHRRCLSVLEGLQALGYEIHLASSDLFTDQPWTDESVFGLLDRHGIQAHPYFANETDREFVNRAAASSNALWEMHTPPGLVARFRELARELEPTLVLVNYAYCAPLIAGPEFARTTCLVEMHDLVSLSGAMARAASACLPPAPLTPAKVSLNFLDEDFFARIGLSTDAAEFEQYARFDGVNAISASEAELVRSALPDKPVAATPVTILPVQVENTYTEDPLLVIFSNPFNLQGTLYFAQRVLPKIRRAFPEFKLRVVGDACRHLAPVEGLELLGFVPDLAALYAESKFAICPLIGGTGQQVKIVEAMAHGVPVVALRNVAASSPIECGVNGYIANDAEEFAEYVIRLYSEPELCQKLGAAAQATIASKFSPASMATSLQNLIAQATAAKKLHQAQVTTTLNPAPIVSSDRPDSVPPVTRPVRWLAPFFNPSGYASEAINFVVPLANKLRLGIQHHNRIYSEAFVAGLASAERETLFRLRDNFASLRGGIVIYHTPAEGFGIANDADYVIGRTMYEAEGLPTHWVNRCNLMDEVWVPSHFNLETFAAAGVEREKLVVIPEAVDETVFDPSLHAPLELPRRAKFNFLAVFEWTTRKGWDALLGAYLQEFTATDDVCLYLRAYLVNEPDGNARAKIERKISDFAKSLGLGDNKALPRIEILSEQIPSADLPRLYRAVDCLVAPSRGEGWGRPQHEAMMMGLPVIATGWSGNTEFMTSETAYLIEYDLVTAAQLEPELWHYRGHRWANPRVDHLRQLMREVERNPAAAAAKGQAARRHVLQRFSRPAVAERVQRRLAEIETRLNSPVQARRAAQGTATSANPKPLLAIPIAWNGTFLDYGSLSHVNRELTRALEQQASVKLTRVGKNVLPPELAKTPALQDTARQLRAQAPAQAQVVIRHAWPPNWDAPANGAWVMMQPWEFGMLPQDWVKQLDRVDEVWAYTEYVRRVYVDSGVDPAKVKVVPLGIDPAKFRPEAKPLALTTAKTFKFLFIGGTIHRKGPDLLLKAFLEAFSANDDVCLVIKDFGGKSVYAGQTMSEQIQALQTNPNAPEILYLTDELPPEALPGLYTACDCLVHPYRGEGFGLPVLEAMACGLPVIVTAGGSTDDFATEETAYRLPARRHSIGARLGEWELVRNGWLLEPDHDALVTTMKRVVQNPAAARATGAAASKHARQFWTWEHAAHVASEHIQKLNERKKSEQRALTAKQERKAAALVLPAAAKAGQLGKARQLLQAGNHAGALAAIRAALNERPFHPEAWLLLAEVAATTGHLAIARAWAEHTVRLAPGFKPAKQFLKSLRSPASANKTPTAKAGDWPMPDTQISPRLSVCLIVRNEEKFLPGCLRSLDGFAQQIVVVDTGSTDRTVEIARSFGAEVFSTTWTDDFSAARNIALEHARGDWVLVLDADEELAPGAGEKLARALRVPGVMAYRLPIVDAGREEEGCSYVPRLFRNAPGLFYVGRIHEQVFSSVEVRREEWGLENRLGDVMLLHHGYTAEVTRDRDKVARNLRLLERAVEEMPNEPNLLMNFGLELVRAGQLEAGLVQYREACQTLAALPVSQIVPELRETLLTQLATHLMAAKQHEEIVHLLRSPLGRMAPLTASLHFVLGLTLMELRQPLDAAEQFKTCLQKRSQAALSPVNKDIRKAGPRHCLALCLAQLKRLTEAEAVFEEALMDDPHSRPMRFDYARLLHELGRPLDAIKLLHQLVAERADDLPVWQLGGQIALSQPQFHEFADDWTREACQHFPQDDLLRQQQAEALLFNHKAAEALPLLRSLENGTAHRATAGTILGELLANESPHARVLLNEPAVSQEFLLWYRRLIKANASEAVQSVNEQLDSLDQVLPSATRVLRQAVQASNEPARQTGLERTKE